MALLTLGLNHNTAPVALREKLAFPTKEAIGAALSDLRGHLKSLAPEAAILSTCNRTEIYCKTDAPDEAGQALTEWIGRHRGVDGEGNLAEHLYLLPNQGAVRHAFRVASGLDSMVLGEPQILGQMKTAARVAQDSNMLGSHLHQLFQRSFSVAKEVRTQTAIGAQSVSMSAASVRLGEQIFENLADCSVLLIGAGEMIELCAAHWAPHPRRMVIANRTLERARKMLAKGEDPAVVLEALSRALTAKFMHGPTTLLSHHAGKDPELANMLSGLLPVPRGGR